MTTPSDDNAGSPLWPGELRRELGAKYVQITQVAADAGLTEGQAAQVLKTLADIGTLQPWVAPECPECGHANLFWGRMDGEVVIEHFGRRCQGLVERAHPRANSENARARGAGASEQCSFRFRFKVCVAI